MLPNVGNRYKRIGISCGLVAQTGRVPGVDAAWSNPGTSCRVRCGSKRSPVWILKAAITMMAGWKSFWPVNGWIPLYWINEYLSESKFVYQWGITAKISDDSFCVCGISLGSGSKAGPKMNFSSFKSQNFWIAVTLGTVLYIDGAPIALANHQPSQNYGSGDIYLILFGMLVAGAASVIAYSTWNKRRKRRLRKVQRSSRRKRG